MDCEVFVSKGISFDFMCDVALFGKESRKSSKLTVHRMGIVEQNPMVAKTSSSSYLLSSVEVGDTTVYEP